MRKNKEVIKRRKGKYLRRRRRQRRRILYDAEKIIKQTEENVIIRKSGMY